MSRVLVILLTLIILSASSAEEQRAPIWNGPVVVEIADRISFNLDAYFLDDDPLVYVATSPSWLSVNVKGNVFTAELLSNITQSQPVVIIAFDGSRFTRAEVQFVPSTKNSPLAQEHASYATQDALGNIAGTVEVTDDGVRFVSGNNLIELDGTALTAEVSAKFGLLDELSTYVASLQQMKFERAHVVLEAYAEVDTIFKCDSFDHALFTCGNWVPTDIPFSANGETVSFEAKTFDAYAGGLRSKYNSNADWDLDLTGKEDVIILLKERSSAPLDLATADAAAKQDWIDEKKMVVQFTQERVLRNVGGVDVKNQFKTIAAISATIDKKTYERLKNHPEVAAIYKDGIVQLANDASIPRVKADVAHNNTINGYHVNGTGVSVCVIDTGIEANHSAFGNRVLAERCFCSISDLGSGGCCPNKAAADTSARDDNGHGTHAAGTIASSNASFPGVASGAGLVVVKTFNSGGSASFSDVAAAIDYCNDNAVMYNISAISMSFGTDSIGSGAFNKGGSGFNESSTCDSSSSSAAAVTAAINTAYGLGMVPVAASGNDGYSNGISYPACMTNVTSVGATGSTDAPAPFSNSDELLDIYAPGIDICSARASGGNNINGAGSLKCDSANNFIEADGTSFSTPHVAGAVALIKQMLYLKNENKTPGEVRDLLKSAADVNITKSGVSKPFLNVLNAVLKEAKNMSIDNAADRVFVAGVGSINFSNETDFAHAGQCINITERAIAVDSDQCPQYNKSAVIEFNNLGFANASVKFNGKDCPSGICTEIAYDGNNLRANVTQFSTYTAEDATEVEPNVTVLKSANVTTARVGDHVSYLISVTARNTTAVNVTVTDLVPNGTTLLSTNHAANGTPDVTWLLGNMTNTTVLLRLIVNVSNATNGTIIQNVVNATFFTDDGGLRFAENSSAAITVLVPDSEANITLTKSANVTHAAPGDHIRYEINVTNSGGTSAINVTVQDSIPNGTTALSEVSWAGNISPGMMMFLNLTVNVSAQYIANATVLENELNTTYLNSTGAMQSAAFSGARVTINRTTKEALVVLAKSANVSSVSKDETVLYRINVSNIGEHIAGQVTVTDILPVNMTFVSADPAQNAPGPTFILGSLDAGTSVELRIIARMTMNSTGDVTLTNWVNATFSNGTALKHAQNASVSVTLEGVGAPASGGSGVGGSGGGGAGGPGSPTSLPSQALSLPEPAPFEAPFIPPTPRRSRAPELFPEAAEILQEVPAAPPSEPVAPTGLATLEPEVGSSLPVAIPLIALLLLAALGVYVGTRKAGDISNYVRTWNTQRAKKMKQPTRTPIFAKMAKHASQAHAAAWQKVRAAHGTVKAATLPQRGHREHLLHQKYQELHDLHKQTVKELHALKTHLR